MNQQEEIELILAILGIIVVYIFGKLWWKTMNLPPGPFPLPLAGNFPDLGYKMWRGGAMVEILRGWQKKYGNVFTLWIGPMPTVNLCSFDTATEAMIKKGIHFVDRPKLFLFDVVRKGRGILVSNGVQWTEQRRFALHALKNMGMGKNLMEERILMEIDYRKQYLTSEIDRHGWELLVNPRALFELTVGNIINRILFSERFTQENEEEFFRLKYKIDENMEKASIFDFFIDEWNVKYPPFKQRLERMMPSSMAMLDFVKERIRERKAEIALGKHPLKGEDFVDAFLLQMEHPDADKEIFNEEALAINLMDLWFAGQETTTTVLYWAFALLLLHEDVLHKVQEELDEVTGKDRSQHLTMADRLRTPYFNATVTEILRVACIFPLNLWRTAADDVQVAGYNIKKGTAVTAQLSLIMTDPKFFKQADKFIPERFLGEDGRKLEAMTVAFGMGKRQCLGESLARAEIYLILGNLLLSYDIAKDPENPPSMKAGREIGGFRRAQSYNIVIRRRK